MQAQSVDARRPKKEWRTAWMPLQEIKATGYDGWYSRVTDFIRAWQGHRRRERQMYGFLNPKRI